MNKPSSLGSELDTESYSKLEGGGGGFIFRLSGWDAIFMLDLLRCELCLYISVELISTRREVERQILD